MWSFEGEYKRCPQQSFGGASRTVERAELLNKVKAEREQRENQRRREAASLKLQAGVRGWLCRVHAKRKLRIDCTELLSSTDELTEEIARKTIGILARLFDVKLDSKNLLVFCQLLVKQNKNIPGWIIGSFHQWCYLAPRLVYMALSVITDDINTPYASPLRLIEILTNPECWVEQLKPADLQVYCNKMFTYLLGGDYFEMLVKLLIHHLPEIYDASPHPPIPMAGALLNLIVKPLIIAAKEKEQTLSTLATLKLCLHVLGKLHHSQVRNFIIPALASPPHNCYVPIEIVVKVIAEDSRIKEGPSTPPPPALLHSLLKLMNPRVGDNKDFTEGQSVANYLKAVTQLLKGTTPYLTKINTDQDDDSSDDEAMDTSEPKDPVLQMLAEECIDILNTTEHVSWLLSCLEDRETPEVVLHFSKLTHLLLMAPSLHLHMCRLLYSIVARRQLLRTMWAVLTSLQQGCVTPGSPPVFGSFDRVPLLQVMARGTPLTLQERDTLVPLLTTFCSTLTSVLSILHDSEFIEDHDNLTQKKGYGSRSKLFPFSVEEVVQMSAALKDVCVGLVELAHPDVRMSAAIDVAYKDVWTHCFKVCVGALRQLHLRDTRRHFCPEGHWISHRIALPPNKCTTPFVSRERFRRRRFRPVRWMTRQDLETEGPIFSVQELQRATILEELPFVLPFQARTNVFSTLLSNDRNENQFRSNFLEGKFITVNIRRTYIYEDAFEKLSRSNEPNLRYRIRVQLLNAVGLDEAGIDGGGIFREFLSELLQTAFDPTRGFFLLTRENTLYPNPGAHLIAENYREHYYFIGRMLGKALYENLLVEIPLAAFFLSKLLLGRSSSSSIEFHHLDSLDPELCRNLLYLKTYNGDVQDLGLDFTVLNSELGQNTVEELIPNGSNIAVNNENCIEYIYRMADYKLNKQIAKQCNAFRDGLFDVISADWLQMFDWRELQMLISGASAPVDIKDLKNNTVYSGSYNEEHPTIKAFWEVVCNFNEKQRRQLLKFVTSCSRPPLLGFKDLQPAFCIQPVADEVRLPTAATCMNLLKLPQYPHVEVLREKLLYAITSGAGFELS
ncbi:ubiquitin-protein ligase E3C isoform X2 [Oratosquilla oratoria]